MVQEHFGELEGRTGGKGSPVMWPELRVWLMVGVQTSDDGLPRLVKGLKRLLVFLIGLSLDNFTRCYDLILQVL